MFDASRLPAEFEQKHLGRSVFREVKTQRAVVAPDIGRHRAARTPRMNLMDAEPVLVLVGRTPDLEQRGPARGGCEEVFELNSPKVFVENGMRRFEVGVVEPFGRFEPALRQDIPNSADQSDPHPGIKSGVAIPLRKGVDGNLRPRAKSRVHRDPYVVHVVGIRVILDPHLQFSAHRMDEGRAERVREQSCGQARGLDQLKENGL